MYREKIIILHAKSYEMYDETAKEHKRGLTLLYLNKGKLYPVDKTENGTYEGGYKPAKASVPVDMLSKINQVPGLYEAEFDLAVSSSNQTVLKLQDFNFVRNLDLSDLRENAQLGSDMKDDKRGK